MLEFYKLYLPKTKKEVKIEVFISKLNKDNKMDSIYFLDGQNAFLDSHATYGRSIRAAKSIEKFIKMTGKNILGIGVWSGESDKARTFEYSPYEIDELPEDYKKEFNRQNHIDYCYDFVNTIIPFIEKKYNVYRSKSHRAIYGSSLGSIAALSIAYNHPKYFKTIGAFSTPTFLFHDEFMNFLKENITKYKKDIFVYCGKNETSDEKFLPNDYINSTDELYKLLKENKIRTRLVYYQDGIHNEGSWDKYILHFLNFIYFKNEFYEN